MLCDNCQREPIVKGLDKCPICGKYKNMGHKVCNVCVKENQCPKCGEEY